MKQPCDRRYGNIRVIELCSGVALIVDPPLPNGDPDTSEEHLREWEEMRLELHRDGYAGVHSAEPDHSFSVPLTPTLVGDIDCYVAFKTFDHYTLDLVEKDKAWAS